MGKHATRRVRDSAHGKQLLVARGRRRAQRARRGAHRATRGIRASAGDCSTSSTASNHGSSPIWRSDWRRSSRIGTIATISSDTARARPSRSSRWRGVSLTGGFSDERWLTRDTRNPFTLFRGEVDWRPNPPVDEGRMHIATGTFVVDTRNDEDNPWSGWHISADWERGRRHAVARQCPNDCRTAPDVSCTTPIPTTYSRGFLDLAALQPRFARRAAESARAHRRLAQRRSTAARAASIGRWTGSDAGLSDSETKRSGVDLGTCNVGTMLPGPAGALRSDRAAAGGVPR